MKNNVDIRDDTDIRDDIDIRDDTDIRGNIDIRENTDNKDSVGSTDYKRNMFDADNLGIYVHIPFCVSKCVYCDFLSSPQTDEVKARYINALCQSIRADETNERRKLPVNSVFFGGGTPSLIKTELLLSILDSIKDRYNLTEDAEITIEANPGTVNLEKLKAYRDAGINRISFGIQSAIDSELKMLGRVHNFTEAKEAVYMAKEVGFDNINADIIMAIPGADKDKFKYTLDSILKLDLPHISAYSLIIEEGTKLYDSLDTFPKLPDEDSEREMYYMLQDCLTANGYRQYEISNFAREGYESVHNRKYWQMLPYIGYGIAAASFYDGRRYSVTADLDKFISNPLASIENVELLDKKDYYEEFVFLGLRMNEGISREEFQKRFGLNISDIYGKVIESNLKKGLLLNEDDRLKLSRRGIDLANTVMSDFILT